MGKVIVVNHKMNMTLSEILNYMDKVSSISSELIVCPSLLYIPYFLDKGFEVGIQNISTEDKGAFTGEVSARQAKSVGVRYALIGHSERRRFFNETDEIVNLKIKKALQNNLNVLLCVGEDEGEDYKEVIKNQITFGLKNVTSPVMISYEPVWAIGSNRLPSLEKISEIANYIKSFFDYDVKVFYGGSVNIENAQILKDLKEVSGFIVSSASLDPNELIKIREVL